MPILELYIKAKKSAARALRPSKIDCERVTGPSKGVSTLTKAYDCPTLLSYSMVTMKVRRTGFFFVRPARRSRSRRLRRKFATLSEKFTGRPHTSVVTHTIRSRLTQITLNAGISADICPSIANTSAPNFASFDRRNALSWKMEISVRCRYKVITEFDFQ